VELDNLLGWPPELLHSIHTHGKRKRKWRTEGIESSIQVEEGRLPCNVTNGAGQREEEGHGDLGVDEEGGCKDGDEPIGELEPGFDNDGAAGWFDVVDGLYPVGYEHGWDGYQPSGEAFPKRPTQEQCRQNKERPPHAPQMRSLDSDTSESEVDDGSGDLTNPDSVKHRFRDSTWNNFSHTYDPPRNAFTRYGGPRRRWRRTPSFLTLFHMFWPMSMLMDIVA
jgi:hypothetical protein